MLDLDTGKEVKLKPIKVESVKDTSRGIIFQRAAVKILKKIPMFIPLGIEKAIIGLNDKFPGVEFSIFAKGIWNPDEEYLEISETFVIPEQEVSSGHIEYLEDPGIEFDCVIHKHPSGCHSFSGTDWQFINANMRHSALWCDGKFWEATTSIFYDPYDCNIRLPAEVYTEQSRGIIPDGADKIKVQPTPNQFHIPNIGGPYKNLKGDYRESHIWKRGLDDDDFPAHMMPNRFNSVPDYNGSLHRHRLYDPYNINDILGDELTEDELGGFIDDSEDDETDMQSRGSSSRMDGIMSDLESMQAFMETMGEEE